MPDVVWPGIRDTKPLGLYRGPLELSDGRHVARGVIRWAVKQLNRLSGPLVGSVHTAVSRHALTSCPRGTG